MFRRLEFKAGASNKFWELRTKGSALKVRFGRIGTEGQTQAKSFSSDGEARTEAEDLIRSKLKKGYADVTDHQRAAEPRARAPSRHEKRNEGPKGPSLPSLPKELRPFVDKHAVFLKDLSLMVFDWRALPESARARFLSRVFSDCDLEEGDYRGLAEHRGGQTVWTSREFLPFALQIARGSWREVAIDKHGSTPQLEEFLLLKGDEVHSIEMDGTALRARKPKRRKRHYKDLRIRLEPRT